MNLLPSSRKIYLISLSFTVLLLALGAYIQTHDGFVPCPLCILQRLALVILALIFCLGAVFKLKRFGQFMISLLAGLISSLGCVLAGRQVWLQHLPLSQTSDCGASLEYMVRVFPLHEVLKKVFAGSAECSRVDWQFLGFSLAECSLIAFSVLLIISIYQFCRLLNKRL